MGLIVNTRRPCESGDPATLAHRAYPRFWGVAFLAALVLLAGCTALKRFAYEGFGRDGWQKPDEVIAALALRAGDRIADIGSGSGYFTLRLARAVGPSGKVYAVDIDHAMNEDLAARAREAGLANIEIVNARVDDPMLPARARPNGNGTPRMPGAARSRRSSAAGRSGALPPRTSLP